MLKQIGLTAENCRVHIASFDRPNIYLQSINMRQGKYRGYKIDEVMLAEIRKYHKERNTVNDPIIVYCGTRKELKQSPSTLDDVLG